jgi:hypothetical protein
VLAIASGQVFDAALRAHSANNCKRARECTQRACSNRSFATMRRIAPNHRPISIHIMSALATRGIRREDWDIGADGRFRRLESYGYPYP